MLNYNDFYRQLSNPKLFEGLYLLEIRCFFDLMHTTFGFKIDDYINR